MKRNASIARCAVLSALLASGLSLRAMGGSITLAWDPPTDNEALEPMEEKLVQFKVYFGTASNHYEHCLNVGNATTATLTNLQEGARYFVAVTAYAEKAGESDYSSPLELYAPDLTPPCLTVAESIVVIADAQGCALVPDLRDQAVVTDNCSGSNEVILSQAPAGRSVVRYGLTPVRLQAVDGAGNVTEKTVQLTVKAENGTDDDLDADALADAWEVAHFGSLTCEEGAADADSDGDGVVNLAEYVAGTDPRDARSVNTLRFGSTGGNGLSVAFEARRTSGPGYEGKSRFFRLEVCTNLGANVWVPVEGYERIAASDQTVTCQLAADSGAPTFFRTRAWLQ